MNCIRVHVRFEQPALEATLAHYLEEIDHIAGRIAKLEQAIDEAVKQAAPENPRGDRSTASVARGSADDGSHRGERVGQSVAIPKSAATDGP